MQAHLACTLAGCARAVSIVREDSRFRRQDLIVYRVPISVARRHDELISRDDMVAVEPRQQGVSAELAPEAPANCAAAETANWDTCEKSLPFDYSILWKYGKKIFDEYRYGDYLKNSF